MKNFQIFDTGVIINTKLKPHSIIANKTRFAGESITLSTRERTSAKKKVKATKGKKEDNEDE
jgi:hypothetical protein